VHRDITEVILQKMRTLKLSLLWNIMPQALIFVAEFKFLVSGFRKKKTVASDVAKVPIFPVAEYCHEFLP
jgi:hypothetical protein